MKLAKCAALAATITGALAASCGVVYGFCAIEWLDSTSNLQKYQDVDAVALRFETFLDFLFGIPAHYFALIGLFLLFLLVVLLLYGSVSEKRRQSLIQRLNWEEKNESYYKEHLKEIERDLKCLFRRYDLLPKESKVRTLYKQRINALLNELKETNFQLQCTERLLRDIREKLD